MPFVWHHQVVNVRQFFFGIHEVLRYCTNRSISLSPILKIVISIIFVHTSTYIDITIIINQLSFTLVTWTLSISIIVIPFVVVNPALWLSSLSSSSLLSLMSRDSCQESNLKYRIPNYRPYQVLIARWSMIVIVVSPKTIVRIAAVASPSLLDALQLSLSCPFTCVALAVLLACQGDITGTKESKTPELCRYRSALLMQTHLAP